MSPSKSIGHTTSKTCVALMIEEEKEQEIDSSESRSHGTSPKELRIPPVIVGIGGATRSGKTTLSITLHGLYKSPEPPLTQDLFASHPFKDEKTGYKNWEEPTHMKWALMKSTLKEWIEKNTILVDTATANPLPEPHFIFFEGFLLFEDEELNSLFDIKMFISVSKSVCKTRRMKTTKVPERYFEQLVWPCYLKYNSKILRMIEVDESKERMGEVYVINGDDPPEQVVQKAKEYMERWKSKTERTPSGWKRVCVQTNEEKLAGQDLLRKSGMKDSIPENSTPSTQSTTSSCLMC